MPGAGSASAARALKRSRVQACARCKATGPAVIFPTKAINGVPAIKTACLRCFSPSAKSYQHLFSWDEMCAKCAEDDDFNREFEKTCKIDEGSIHVEFHKCGVNHEVTSGYTVRGHYVCIPEKEFETIVGVEGITAKTARLASDSIPNPHGSGSLNDVLVQHPERKFTEDVRRRQANLICFAVVRLLAREAGHGDHRGGGQEHEAEDGEAASRVREGPDVAGDPEEVPSLTRCEVCG